MKAVVLRSGQLVVDDVEDPTPRDGQVLARTLACGICGSDLHAVRHADAVVQMLEGATGPDGSKAIVMDTAADVVMGHEFVAEVVECGPGVQFNQPGDIVVSMPIAFDTDGVHPIGYSNRYPGGYGELMCLVDAALLKVPNGISPTIAAFTEPMAVGRHAVNRSTVAEGDAAVVVGCGPVGLAVIADLALKGIGPIVAADFSPRRRQLAEVMGAHVVVDPRDENVFDALRRTSQRTPHIFEAVGVPGLLDEVIGSSPMSAQICVVGVCLEPDMIRPSMAVARETTLRFARGYEPWEFAETLRDISNGDLSVEPLLTGVVDLDGVPQAFTDLGDPENHAKIIVRPN